METTDTQKIIDLLVQINSRLDYVEAQIEYTQSILGSFHPDPVLRDHCQRHLKNGVEEIYSDTTIERLRAQFPVEDPNVFLRGILKDAVQKLDTVSVMSHQGAG